MIWQDCCFAFAKASYLYLHKQQTMRFFIFFLVTLYTFLLGQTGNTVSSSHTIVVNIKDVANDDGQLVIGLYNKESEFLQNAFKGQVAKIVGGEAQIIFNNIPSGTYAISLFHDRNSNGKLDTNFLGIPREDYACSNQAKSAMSAPKWVDAKFDVNVNIEMVISLD